MNKPEMSQETASELWQKAIELRNSDKKGKIKKAIQLVQRIIEERNNHPPISTKLRTFVGDCYHLDLEQHDKAMDYFFPLLDALCPDNFVTWTAVVIPRDDWPVGNWRISCLCTKPGHRIINTSNEAIPLLGSNHRSLRWDSRAYFSFRPNGTETDS